MPSPITQLSMSPFDERGVNLYLKRDDLIHPWVQGNKWRKLKYNIQDLQVKGYKHVVSPGGAFSNHLMALAALCHYENIAMTALVRGELDPNNPNLKKLIEFGADLECIPRSEFRSFHAYTSSFHPGFPASYFIPEGGTNARALIGVGEIFSEITSQLEEIPDYIIVPMGTGGTFAGLLSNVRGSCKLVGISSFANYSFESILQNLLGPKLDGFRSTFDIFHFEQFGRFGKVPDFILAFIREMYDRHQIMLDPIYTGKMMWGLNNLCEKGYFPEGSKILAIHTGGLQGWMGFNYRFPERGGLVYNKKVYEGLLSSNL